SRDSTTKAHTRYSMSTHACPPGATISTVYNGLFILVVWRVSIPTLTTACAHANGQSCEEGTAPRGCSMIDGSFMRMPGPGWCRLHPAPRPTRRMTNFRWYLTPVVSVINGTP